MSGYEARAEWPRWPGFAFAKGRRPNPEDFERIAALRELRGRGGPFFGGGSPFGGGPPFGGGRGRKRRGDLRIAVLLLLAEEARNGYQLMQEIEERSGGRWRPSPGSVYPTLAQLEDEGLIRSVQRDSTKLLELTDAGREQLAGRGDEAPPWEGGEESDTVSDLKAEIKQLHMISAFTLHAGDPDQMERAAKLLAETRRKLYGILAEESDA